VEVYPLSLVLSDVYAYEPNTLKSTRIKWAGHVACVTEMRNAYTSLVGKTDVKRPLGRPRRRWEDNIRMDCREIV